jgi:phage-related protein
MTDEPHPAGFGEDWEVVRTDDNGNTFAVRSGMTEEAARQLHDTLTRRGHKQMGWTAPTASMCHDAGCLNRQQGAACDEH